jgi:mannose-1-phosphate guanylyltransferase
MRQAADGREHERWGLILAGGRSLLEQTRRRAALAIPPAQTLLVLTRSHERYYAPLVAGLPPRCAIVQPEGRGTAAAILYGVLRIAASAPLGAVAVLPSDHYVSDDPAFMRHVAAAFSAVRARPELVVLLGITPESAETEYGWIEPAEPIPGSPLFRVARFWEKPAPVLAQVLAARGCLWNSLIMIARVPALLAMIRSAAPDLARRFAAVAPALGTAAEAGAVRALYRRLVPQSFADDVLASRPANLAVLPVEGVRWTDWGQPQRVIEAARLA